MGLLKLGFQNRRLLLLHFVFVPRSCNKNTEHFALSCSRRSKLVRAKTASTEAAAAAQPTKMVLKWEDVELGKPKEGEIRVKNKAIGLNFIDVYFRKEVYKAATMPITPD
ncbi:hypothetical protein DITRI_Ditri04bG0007600 [Diplodiscus trichospermus]